MRPDPSTLSTRDLGTLLRLGDPHAVRYVRRVMREHGGVVRYAARAMQIREATLQGWLASLPALAGIPRLSLEDVQRRAIAARSEAARARREAAAGEEAQRNRGKHAGS